MAGPVVTRVLNRDEGGGRERARYGEYQGGPRDYHRRSRAYYRDADGCRDEHQDRREDYLREAQRYYAHESDYRCGSYEGYGPEGFSRSVYGPGGYGGEERGWWDGFSEEVSSWFSSQERDEPL